MDKKTYKLEWKKAHPGYDSQKGKEWRTKNRLIALQKVARSDNPYCLRCKTQLLEILQINHKNLDGLKDRGGGKKNGGHAVFLGKIAGDKGSR